MAKRYTAEEIVTVLRYELFADRTVFRSEAQRRRSFHCRFCKQAKASWILLAHHRAVFVDRARFLLGKMAGQRKHLSSYVMSIHEIQRELRRPSRHRG